jgi:tetratricopeptide (TPR) repeat protein
MEAQNQALPKENQKRLGLRVLRPLLCWVFFVLLLFAFQTHKRLSQETRLKFSVLLEGRPVRYEVVSRLDGRELASGSRVGIGWKTLSFSHPKAGSFSTNFFIWYGENDLGSIGLTRSMGTLVIEARPPAQTLTIRGPEFTRTFTDISGTNFTVPTDRYLIEAKYSHWQKEERISVSALQSSTVRFHPPFGTLQMESSNSGVSFELRTDNNRVVGSGDFPSVLRELPEGEYTLTAHHNRNEKREIVAVKAGKTNRVDIHFTYGAAVFETSPAGAMVTTEDGRNWGKTPLALPELKPGFWKFTLSREGFEPAFALVEIAAQKTNTFQTNLVNTTYLGAVNAARRYLDSENFALAHQAALEALRVNPNDPIAADLKRKSFGMENIRLAKGLAAVGEFALGIKSLELALEAFPENGEARNLIERYRKNERDANERAREDWLNRGKKIFAASLKRYDGADLFDSRELRTKKPVEEVARAIVSALQTGDPTYQKKGYNSPVSESFVIEASHDMPLLSLKSGRRDVVIVGTQTRDDETEILFKILEYKPDIRRPEGAPPTAGVIYVPIHSSRLGTLPGRLQTQVKEGIADVTARIQKAISVPMEQQKNQ